MSSFHSAPFAQPSPFDDWRMLDPNLARALSQLRSGDFQNRWDAAKLIPPFGEAAIAPLLALLQAATDDSDEDDWELMWFIARILGDLQHPAALSALVDLIQITEQEDVAGMAATALAGMGTEAIAPLCALLGQNSTYAIALQALTQIRHPDIVPPLLAAVHNASPLLKVAALSALNDFHHPDISAALLNALTDPIASVRQAAVTALGMQAKLNSLPDLVQQIRPLLWDVSPEVCQQAAIALGRINSADALAALVEVLRSPHTPAALQTDILRSLAWIATPDALNGIASFLRSNEHSNSPVREEALAILGRVESPIAKVSATRILMQQLQAQSASALTTRSKQAIALSLSQLGQIEAIDPLIQLLADEETSVRLHVITALKQLAPQIAYEKLQQMALTGVDEPLQRGVAIALAEWG